MLTQLLIDRFWAKVRVLGPDDCWEWTANKNKGYGQLKVPKTRKDVRANRLSLMIRDGVWNSDPKKIACHTCDNPPCCNPNHLFWGSHQDNSDDKISKGKHGGRPQHGILNAACKINEDTIKAIIRYCKRGMNNKEISAMFNGAITHSMVSRIRLGKSWTHLTGGPITRKYESLSN